ncbi:MAG: hypothetical protein ACRDTD_22505, partial [Pseudonocardiaceae bacterium]
HSHRVLDQQASAEFESYLNTFPWGGSQLDWREIPNETLVLPKIVDTGFITLSRRTPWGKHGHIFVMYNGDEPAILCSTEDAVADLDLLYSGAPGTRFFCGAEINGKETKVVHSDFAEYDGFSKIRFPV